MKLCSEINYIVSGLERSGTSMMMRILEAGEIPVAYDESRPADIHNPLGYFELKGGKIINNLKDESFPIRDHRGKFIKITAYGLHFLPSTENYRIVYMVRDLDEIVDSQGKMSREPIKDTENHKRLISRINKEAIEWMLDNPRVNFLAVNYSEVIRFPLSNICSICSFLDLKYDRIFEMSEAVNPKLYRNRRRRI